MTSRPNRGAPVPCHAGARYGAGVGLGLIYGVVKAMAYKVCE